MLEIEKIECGCYYLFESLSSGRSCYFESEEEIKIFKSLFDNYMSKFVKIHRMYLDSEGYQVMLKVMSRETVIKNYKKEREKAGKSLKVEFINEPWKIIGEQMRKMKSLYVRKVNKIRGREGVLVKRRFSKYCFVTIEEMERYVREKEGKVKLKSQRRKKYRVGKKWRKLVKWGRVRRREWGGSSVVIGLQDLVVSKLVKKTLLTHAP